MSESQDYNEDILQIHKFSVDYFDKCITQNAFVLSLICFVFTARCLAERGTANASCLSVCPSVTLRYHDHIRWDSGRITSRLISLTSSLFADPNMTDLLQREL